MTLSPTLSHKRIDKWKAKYKKCKDDLDRRTRQPQPTSTNGADQDRPLTANRSVVGKPVISRASASAEATNGAGSAPKLGKTKGGSMGGGTIHSRRVGAKETQVETHTDVVPATKALPSVQRPLQPHLTGTSGGDHHSLSASAEPTRPHDESLKRSKGPNPRAVRLNASGAKATSLTTAPTPAPALAPAPTPTTVTVTVTEDNATEEVAAATNAAEVSGFIHTTP